MSSKIPVCGSAHSITELVERGREAAARERGAKRTISLPPPTPTSYRRRIWS